MLVLYIIIGFGVLNFLLFFIRIKLFFVEFFMGLLREDLLFFVVFNKVFFISVDDFSLDVMVILVDLVNKFIVLVEDDLRLVI